MLFLINYWSPNIGTFPNLSMPSMERTYLQMELTGKSEVSIENGIQEMEVMRKHKNLRELYNIQQLIYGNAAYLYRLLHRILSLFEETFNPNIYHNSKGYDYSEISNSILNLLDSSDFNEDDREALSSHISHINQSLVKFHSILLNIYDIKTSTACHNLRNYFSISPPNKSLKTSKYKMSEYITENHSGQRIPLFQTFTKNPTAFKHLFLTSSIEIEKSPPDDKGNIKEKHIRIHFRERDIDIKAFFDLSTNSLGLLYHDLLSAILHDAIPHYTKPDDISKQYLASNTLCTIIVMELLLIHWKNLSKCLRCYYNNTFRRYVFSQVIYELSKKLPEDNPVSEKLFDSHVQLMDIIEAIEIERKKYTQNFANYMKYIQTEPQRSYRTIFEKKIDLPGFGSF